MNDSYCVGLAALDNFDLAVARFDLSGVMTYRNAAAARLFGVPENAAVDIAMLFPDPTERARIFAQIRERAKGKSGTYRTAFHPPFGSPDADDVPVGVFAFPDSDDAGNVLGSVALIRDLREEVVRERIHTAIEESTANDTMFRELTKQLRILFEFDELRVVMISKSNAHLRRLFTTDAGADARFPFRWWPLPPFLLETLPEWEPQVMEVDQMLADPHYQELLARDDATRAFFESGVRQVLSLPVYENDRIVAFFSLDSRVDGRYDDASVKLLQRLPVTQAVVAALHREERKLQRHTVELIRDLGASIDVQQAAQELVTRLVKDFGWPHVSIFQCDPARHQFQLVFQANICGGPVLPDVFEVSGDSASSAIVEAAVMECEVNVPTTRSRGPLSGQPGFIPAGSQFALPIQGRKVQWILNIESHYENAFSTEEIDLLKVLAVEAGSVLHRSALFELQRAVLSSINDAVIETNDRGLVRWSNQAAHALLGLDAGSNGHVCIFDLIADEALRNQLRASPHFDHVHVNIQGKGRLVPVLLSGTVLPSHLSGRVYVCTDFTYQKEVLRLTELKDVFRQAALEGRVPLALASVWLRQLVDKDPALREPVDKIAAQLGRADLPLERLLRLFSMDTSPGDDPRADLNFALRMTLAELPESLASAVDSRISGAPLPVAVALDNLQFCVESMISFGLRTRPQSKRLHVYSELDDTNAIFRVQGEWTPDLSSDMPLGPAEETRRKSLSDLALGESVIERIIASGQGQYSCELDEALCLSFSLPLLAH